MPPPTIAESHVQGEIQTNFAMPRQSLHEGKYPNTHMAMEATTVWTRVPLWDRQIGTIFFVVSEPAPHILCWTTTTGMELCCAFEAWLWKVAMQKWVCNCFTYATVCKNKFDQKGGVWNSKMVHFVFYVWKTTPAFGWHDEFRGGYLGLFNKMPPFVGLSTIAHGWLAKMNAFQKLAGKQRKPWVFNAQPIPVKIEPEWQPFPSGNTFYVCRCFACCQPVHNRFLQLPSRHISSHFQRLKLPQRRVIHIRLALVAPNLDLHAKRKEGMFRLVLASNWVVVIRTPSPRHTKTIWPDCVFYNAKSWHVWGTQIWLILWSKFTPFNVQEYLQHRSKFRTGPRCCHAPCKNWNPEIALPRNGEIRQTQH